MQSVLAGKRFAVTAVATAFLALAGRAAGGDLSLPVTGNLIGSVVDATNTPQRGATVRLFNKYQRLVSKTTTTVDGRFAFSDLPADFYSVRVSLASFLPAARDQVAIRAGLDSVLKIHLATLFSSIEVRYSVPSAAMTDDWKWVLRSSPSTRLITRYMPAELPAPGTQPRTPVFSGTHAMVSVSGGAGDLLASDSDQPDLGTGFALSTNVLGKNQLQVGGAVGQSMNLGTASMGFAAIYSRKQDNGFSAPPEVTLAMSQFGLLDFQQAGGTQLTASNTAGGSPTLLRTMSISLYNAADVLDRVHLEYGMTGESVEYVQHRSRISPFARITISAGNAGELIAAYTNGGRPDELIAHRQSADPETSDASDTGSGLNNAVSAMSRVPQISDRDGRLELQRTQSYEIGYRKVNGSRTYSASAFHEVVSNGRINVAGTMSPLDGQDLLWDGISPTASYNIGNYTRNGYILSADQRMDDLLEFAAAYGRMGGFAVDQGGPIGASETGSGFLRHTNDNMAAATVKARVPGCGTRVIASYGWVDAGSIIPVHVFTTQDAYISPGVNISVRQPLPPMFGVPGRIELTADVRNLLAQGYIPVAAAPGRSLLIVQSPRVIRGGLNFIF